jgi:hypothetical protein
LAHELEKVRCIWAVTFKTAQNVMELAVIP